MKSLSKSKMILFAIGQLGWSLLSGLISNWLVYYYQPDATVIDAGQKLFITQGVVIFGIFTIIGCITAVGRLFDAVTDPWIASLSDRCKSKNGRRIPFLKWAALPLSVSTVLVFCAPIDGISKWNAIWLFVFVMIYYVSITAYCTPYNALIAELGHTQEERLNISTTISLTFFVGTALAYAAPVVWGVLEGVMGRMPAMKTTFVIFATVAFICMLVPVFAIKEKEYVISKPSKENAFASLIKTFKNRNFRAFVGSDVLYWIALTMFQTGLPFFVTALLRLDEKMSTVYFVGMSILSVAFYVPINMLSRKVGKKRLVIIAFLLFAVSFAYTAFFGKYSFISPVVQGAILVIIAAFPMAIFGILPQAMVADVAEGEAIVTGANREGMFYAARTFAFKLGQSVAMLIFTAVSTIGTGEGYRFVAVIAAVLCLIGGLVLLIYNEKSINETIAKKTTN